MQHSIAEQPRVEQVEKGLDFSLFYFDGKGGSGDEDKYRLLVEGAKFADEHGFEAVWTPERHFHAFGGMYPNPSVTSAALAMVTRNICLRAGSVVAPLHHYLRIAEEWALIDNLSHGRVGVSFASGWHVNDFVLAPAQYPNRKEEMIRSIQKVQRLWRGEPVTLENGGGKTVDVQIFPRPVQRELPVWVTCSGNPETFELAGQLGAGVLTHLLGQTVDELRTKINLYRESLAQHGHASTGQVTLMIHTYIGESVEAVRETIRNPFCEYLRSSLSLIKNQLQNASGNSAIPWRKSGRGGQSERATRQYRATDDLDSHELVAHAFDRYFDTAALFGTPEKCLSTLELLQETGVNEVACLIDFGVNTDSVLRGLEYLDSTKNMYESRRKTRAASQIQDFNEDLSA
ncbi:MAG TPA: LLM class flavin-dependent oxidoreductase [Candidatus Dormibacteraeota bacterium]|jgi:natural product biosynthesis luciferase-like monooxygenase protein|nr:LLM class flavin-dependent oxidoreductase [Candidatus Dormibacteraeota bacterium]